MEGIINQINNWEDYAEYGKPITKQKIKDVTVSGHPNVQEAGLALYKAIF